MKLKRYFLVLVISLFAASTASTQTVTFSHITDALNGFCYDPVTTVPDPADGNRLLIGTHTGIDPVTWMNRACSTSTGGFSSLFMMDTISFLVSPPSGYRIINVSITQASSASGSRGGRGYVATSWVVNGTPANFQNTGSIAVRTPKNPPIWVSVSTTLVAAGDSARSASATATNPVVSVELALME